MEVLMRFRFTRLTISIIAGVAILVILAIILVGVLVSRPSGTSTQGKTHNPPYRIALSNSYIGNTWRVEMENEFKAACAMPPYKSLVKCSWLNSNNTASTQTQQMDDLISSRVDAIVINAASPTSLNGVIAQACR